MTKGGPVEAAFYYIWVSQNYSHVQIISKAQ
jgi:hypothetical protein